MSLLDKASLIVTPNGYSEDTLYSVVPSSGAGDLSFARATDAWRTNSAGLVQRVCWNLFTFSEDFSSGNWGKSNATITSNVILSPSNTLTGDLYTSLIAGSFLFQVGFDFVVQPYTFSIYVKKYLTPSISIDAQYHLSGSNNTTFSFNFDTGAATGCIAQNAGNGWWRLIATTTLTAARNQIRIVSNDTFYLWGAQLVEGSSALEYFPTTDRQNVPRIDYSLGGCPTLLMEPQRTNGVTESARMYNWGTFTSLGATSPTNVIATGFQDPTGQSSACLVTGTNGTVGSFGIFQLLSTTYTTGTVLTVSVYAKRGTNDFLYLSQANISFTGTGFAYFNLATGTTPTAGAQIVNVGNGWYRCIMPPVTLTANSTASYNIGHYIAPSETSQIWSTNYLGKSMYFYGAQVEAGAYPTSYIPTTTASVTRNADSFVRNNIYTNGLISAAGGTWFIDLRGNNSVIASNTSTLNAFVGDTSNGYNNSIFLWNFTSSSARIQILKFLGGSAVTNLYDTLTDTAKIAVKWNGTTADVFVNGVKVVNATPFNITNMQFLAADASRRTLNINSIMLFPTPLSDAECIKLTTL